MVLTTVNSGWPGGTFISYRLSDGPASGLVIYAAEDIDPLVAAGQSVTSGTPLGAMYEGPDGIETGWADPSAMAPAWPATLDNSREPTPRLLERTSPNCSHRWVCQLGSRRTTRPPGTFLRHGRRGDVLVPRFLESGPEVSAKSRVRAGGGRVLAQLAVYGVLD